MKNIGKVFIAMGCLPALSVSSTQAQQVIEEITVTATKRGSVSVQEIPVAIRAVTGDDLEKFNLRSMEDISRLEPSLQYETSGAGDLQLVVRGIQSAGAGTVGLYFDETVITGANFQDGGGRTPDVGAYDIERVEILKGPQGTLFGASSMSGTVRIISNKPDAEAFDASVSAMADSVEFGDEGYGVNGMINMPLIDETLAVRAVGWQREAGGYIDHYAGLNGETLTKDANDSEISGGRLMLKWTPNSALKINTYVQRQDTQVDGPQTYAKEPSGVHTALPFAFAPITVPGTPTISHAGTLRQDSPTEQYWDDEVVMFGGTIEYDLGFGSLLATVNRYERDTISQTDTTALALSFGFFPNPGPFSTDFLGGHALLQMQDREVTTGELRFSSAFEGPVNFVAGLFYSDDETNTELNILQTDPVTGIPACNNRAACIANPALAATTLDFARTQSIDYEFYALFAHVDYEMTDKVTLGAGIRYFDSEQHNIEFTTQGFGAQGVLPPTQGGPIQTVPIPGVNAKVDEDDYTWEASIAYQQTEDLMYYFRAATGYRQGGINDSSLAAATGVIVPAGFESDEVTSLEFGVKSEWFGNRVILNANYFKMFWDDMHVPGTTANGGFEYIVNAGEAEVDGIEVELFAQLNDQWFFSLGLTWLDARLTSDQILELAAPTDPFGKSGDDIPNVAEWQFAGSVEYSFPSSWLGSVDTTLRANYSYTGESDTFFNDEFDDFTEKGDYFLLDLNAVFTYENWGLTFFVKNVTDKRAIVDFEGADTTTIAEQDIRTVAPRTFGVQVNWNYE